MIKAPIVVLVLDTNGRGHPAREDDTGAQAARDAPWAGPRRSPPPPRPRRSHPAPVRSSPPPSPLPRTARRVDPEPDRRTFVESMCGLDHMGRFEPKAPALHGCPPPCGRVSSPGDWPR
jgi:hypothetical protein